jgi:hypothetical protein
MRRLKALDTVYFAEFPVLPGKSQNSRFTMRTASSSAAANNSATMEARKVGVYARLLTVQARVPTSGVRATEHDLSSHSGGQEMTALRSSNLFGELPGLAAQEPLYGQGRSFIIKDSAPEAGRPPGAVTQICRRCVAHSSAHRSR